MTYDLIVLGSGFSGSLLAWILAAHGRSVLVLDRQKHPRFAIGESSTPTADFLLAHLADRWNLPDLAPLACWGTWKKAYPKVLGGKKRGFSYYQHQPQTPFEDDPVHSNSLLVAASREDQWSDTHWLRSSVDQFLAQKAIDAGATILESKELVDCRWDPTSQQWQTHFQDGNDATAPNQTVVSKWIVDASGGGAALAPWVDNHRDDLWMRTRTRATFAHFTGVSDFHPLPAIDDPFAGDDAAQHHLLPDGWVWMLRMEEAITSVGLVEPCDGSQSIADPVEHFYHRIENFPTIAGLLSNAKRVAPADTMGQTPGRMSRCLAKAAGDGWCALPLAYGFVDPLHSSGIAHALSGVARVAEALLGSETERRGKMNRYQHDLRREVEWIDLLVAACYAAQPSFRRFRAAASLYFVSAIAFEQQLARDPASWPQGFLQSDDLPLRRVAEEIWDSLPSRQIAAGTACPDDEESWVRYVSQKITPWDPVGLLDPKYRNRIAHSAAPKYASIASRTPLSASASADNIPIT